MDLELQKRIMDIAEKFKDDKPIVILGSADAEGTGIVAETVSLGDPSYAGPLTGVQLGLPVYHIFEPEIKNEVSKELYEDKVSMMEIALDAESIIKEIADVRASGSG
jgi:glycine/sarcosine/betaine reductase complex component A